MIAELIAGGAALLVTASGWIAAWRARGQENEAQGAKRLAEVARDAERDRAASAEADRDAAKGELKAAEVARDMYKNTLDTERKEKVALLEKLAALGAPVAPPVLDDAIARLHANPRRVREDPAGGDAGDHGGPVPPHNPNALERPGE